MVTTKYFKVSCLLKAHTGKDFSSECHICLLKYILQEPLDQEAKSGFRLL